MTSRPDADRGRRVLDALPVLLFDAAGEPRYATPALTRLAAPVGDPASEGFDALVAPSDRDAVAAAFASVADGDDVARVAFRGRGDGRRREAVLVDCLADARGECVAAFVSERPGADLPPLAALLESAAAAASSETLVRWVLARAATPAVAFGWYGLDESAATLRAASGSATAEPAVRAAFAAGETAVLDAAAFPLAALPGATPDGGLAVPVGTRGVLVAAVADAGAVDADLLDAVAAVARVLGTGLDRLSWREAARRHRAGERDARATASRLAAVEATADRVQRRVLRASTTAGAHRALVEGLVAADLAASAVVAEMDAETGALVPQTQAGEDRGYHERVPLGASVADPSPLVRAAAERESVAVADVGAGGATAWRTEALACGFRGVLAVPLVVDDVVRGVLAVYLADAAALDAALERAVERLATVAAYAVNAVELRTAFLGNATVELRLRLPDTDLPLSRLAAAAGGPVRFVSATPRSDGATRLFFTAPRAAESLTETDVAGVGEVSRLEERGEDALFVATVPDETVPTAFASLGAVLTEASAEGSVVDVTVVVSRDSDVRELVDAVREVFPGAELLARRARDRPVEATRGFRDAVDERLTGRQLEVLQAAYFAGYFSWPRDHSSSELAATLDIAQPTFSRHLRTAERKLLALLFEHDAASGD